MLMWFVLIIISCGLYLFLEMYTFNKALNYISKYDVTYIDDRKIGVVTRILYTIKLKTGWCVISYELDSSQKNGLYRRCYTKENKIFTSTKDICPLYINSKDLDKLNKVTKYLFNRI